MKDISSHLTPYVDEYETCSETRAELRIYTGELDPASVTERLGLKPSDVNTKGTTNVSKSGRERVVPLNAWFLTSEGEVNSLDSRRHLDWLLQKLRPAKDALLALQEEPEVRMAVTCTWYSAFGHGGPTLWPEQMSRLAEVNLECGFDIYFPDDE